MILRDCRSNMRAEYLRNPRRVGGTPQATIKTGEFRPHRYALSQEEIFAAYTNGVESGPPVH